MEIHDNTIRTRYDTSRWFDCNIVDFTYQTHTGIEFEIPENQPFNQIIHDEK